jgi:hypothetical protein
MMAANTTRDTNSILPGLLFRPIQSLQDLPLEYRWEFTRRHPYYLMFREPAHCHYAGKSKDPYSVLLGQVAAEILLAIGVSGDPPSTTASFEALGASQLSKAWLDGAVAPLTYRALATQLAELPRAARLEVGAKLLASCDPVDTHREEDEAEHKCILIRQLLAVSEPALDALPSRAIVGINLYAPQRGIDRAIRQWVGEMKKEHGIPERRRRPDKLERYLQVWDLREGWAGAGYDPAAEQSFAQIATEVGTPLATVADQYASAFESLCGHPYTFDNWLKLFSVLKVTTQFGPTCLLRRRVNPSPRRPQPVKQVTESTLGGGKEDHDGGLLAGLAIAPPSGTAEDRETIEHIEHHIKLGHDDDEILKDLDAVDVSAMREVIGYFRKRMLGAADAGAAAMATSAPPSTKASSIHRSHSDDDCHSRRPKGPSGKASPDKKSGVGRPTDNVLAKPPEDLSSTLFRKRNSG